VGRPSQRASQGGPPVAGALCAGIRLSEMVNCFSIEIGQTTVAKYMTKERRAIIRE
jgi:hypothetical protein